MNCLSISFLPLICRYSMVCITDKSNKNGLFHIYICNPPPKKKMNRKEEKTKWKKKNLICLRMWNLSQCTSMLNKMILALSTKASRANISSSLIQNLMQQDASEDLRVPPKIPEEDWIQTQNTWKGNTAK